MQWRFRNQILGSPLENHNHDTGPIDKIFEANLKRVANDRGDMSLLAAVSYSSLNNLNEINNRRVLLKNGQDLTKQDNNGNTPFHLVADYFNSYEDSLGLGATVLQELLGLSELAPHHETTKSSLIDALQKKNDGGDTILHIIASKERHVSKRGTLEDRQERKAVEQILSVCPDVFIIRDNDGNTPLHRACLVDNQVMIEALLEEDQKLGPDTYHIADIQNEAGEIPLHSAVRKGHLGAIKKLMSADPPIRTMLSRNNRGQTPLHVAAGQEERQVLEALLVGWRYEDIVFADSKYKLRDVDGMTPLHIAAQNATYAARGLVEQLLKGCTGSELLNDSQLGTGWTSLHFGASAGREEVIELLLLNGADSKKRDKDNLVAAEIARGANRIDATDLIRQYRPRSFRLVLEPNEKHEKVDDHFSALSWPNWDNHVRRRRGESPRRCAQVSTVHQMMFKAHDSHCILLPNGLESESFGDESEDTEQIPAIYLAPIHQAQIRLSLCESKRWVMYERRRYEKAPTMKRTDPIYTYVYDSSVFQGKKRSTRWIHFPANNVSNKITAKSLRSCTDGFNVQRAWIEVCVAERRQSIEASDSNA